MTISFSTYTPLRLETSSRYFAEKELSRMQFNITLKPAEGSRQYGSFECYDIDDPYTYYSEGGLWFKDNELIDYDGVYSLPHQILDYLELNGYDVKHMKEVLK